MTLDVYKEWLGIPEGPRPPDHYQLLRLVQFEDKVDKIRSHYRKLNAHVRRYATGEYYRESQELLNELAKAMLCLTDAERKREYDQSLGREVEEEVDRFGRKPLETVLCGQGLISSEQAKQAERYADARGLSIRDAVVQMKLVDRDAAQRALAQQLGLSYIDLSEMMPDDSVLDKVPRNVIKRHTILPLFLDEDVLLVACADELDPELEDELQLRFGVPVRPVIASPLAINQGIAKYYAPGMRDEAAAKQAVASTGGFRMRKRAKAAAPARKSAAPLTEGELRERRLIGIIVICWAIIGSAVLDWYLVKPMLFSASSWPFYLTLFAPAIAVWYVFRVYWK